MNYRLLTNIETQVSENQNANNQNKQNTEETTSENPKSITTKENSERPTREKKKPQKLNDYICYNTTKYSISNYISYNKFSEKRKALLIKISEHK